MRIVVSPGAISPTNAPVSSEREHADEQVGPLAEALPDVLDQLREVRRLDDPEPPQREADDDERPEPEHDPAELAPPHDEEDGEADRAGEREGMHQPGLTRAQSSSTGSAATARGHAPVAARARPGRPGR